MATANLLAFLTGRQLAKCCKVSLRTVEDWRRRGMGPPYEKRCNGAIRYPIEEANRYLIEYTGKPLNMEDIWEK